MQGETSELFDALKLSAKEELLKSSASDTFEDSE